MRRVAVLRLAPTPEQEAVLDAQGHAARWFWNALHEWYLMCRDHRQHYAPQWSEIDKQLRAFLQHPDEDYEWVKVLSVHSLQHVQQDYEQSWARCYSKRQTLRQAQSPRFKSRHRAQLSFDLPGRSEVSRQSHSIGQIKLPKVGWIRFRWNQALPTEALRGARLVKGELGWQAYVRLDLPDPEPLKLEGSVGIDRGVMHAMTTSDGEFFDLPQLLSAGEQQRLLKLERSAARKQRAHKRGTPRSKRLEKEYDQIRALRARAKRRRRDWQHKATTELARQYGTVSIEKLNVKNMTKSARGTVEESGTNVRAKAGLNRAIRDVGWSQLETMLAYKTDERGSTLVRVPARYTSQTCAECGARDAVSRESQSKFRCTKCGHVANADVNAARNINAAGLAVSGRGGSAIRQPVKRQSASAAAEANA